MTALRICFVGDSITNGTLDEAYLGWPGRLCEAERKRGHDVTLYNLGIRADTTALIAARWEAECRARLPAHTPGALVFAFGVNDTAEEGGTLRVPHDRSLDNARKMIGQARDWLPVLWVGPAPLDEEQQPLRPAPGIEYSFHNQRIKALSDDYAALADEVGVPYLSIFDSLATDPRWLQALRDGDGVHPTGDGYRAMYELISVWPAWRAWFD
jgi:lysophospholipase L1-like esterase